MASYCTSSELLHQRSPSFRSNFNSIITDYLSYVSIFFVCGSLMSTMSAPTGDGRPFWINPCGVEDTDARDGPIPADANLYEGIIRNARVAHLHILTVKKHMISNGIDDEDSVRTQKYDWLQINQSDFKNINRDDAVKESFRLIQNFAVAFEQIFEDNDMDPKFHLEMKVKIRQLLCSMQVLMLGMKIVPLDDPDRSIMPSNLRDLADYSSRNYRNFFIVRDYAKATHHVMVLFEHLESLEK